MFICTYTNTQNILKTYKTIFIFISLIFLYLFMYFYFMCFKNHSIYMYIYIHIRHRAPGTNRVYHPSIKNGLLEKCAFIVFLHGFLYVFDTGDIDTYYYYFSFYYFERKLKQKN